MKTKLTLLVFIFLFLSIFNIYPIDIDTDKIDLEINFLLSTAYTALLYNFNNMFYLDSALISCEGEYKDLSFALKLDFTKYNMDEHYYVPEFLENCFINYKFTKQFQIRFGQFKIPMGEEPSMGMTERPYLDHYYTSRKMGLGRSQGLMLYGKKLLGFIHYKVGVFNTPILDLNHRNQFSISTAAKIYFSNEPIKRIKVRYGYSAYYYSSGGLFSQGIFFRSDWKINKNTMLTLFCEYMEQRYYHYRWNNGFMGYISCRLSDLEPYISFELFDRNVNIDDPDDQYKINGGINYYIIKDYLRIGLEYELQDLYLLGSNTHSLTTYCVLEL